jgi:type VI secretion system secreted protein Hcp
MPQPAYLTLKGETQGNIEGSCDQKGHENTILVQAFNHEVMIPPNPQTGAPTGPRVHKPLTITKVYDKATPKLYLALTSGEHLPSVEMKLYRINNKGAEELYFTTTLEDAIVVSVKPWMMNCLDPNSKSFTHMEDVSFTYRKATWKWVPDGIESEDDWNVPKT